MALIAIALTLMLPRFAQAHAMLQKSNPAANAVVSQASAGHLSIELTFNSRVDAHHSSLSLVAGGKTMQLTIDIKAAPNVLRTETTDLAPGHYLLQWQAVASDGHISRGVVPFSVR